MIACMVLLTNEDSQCGLEKRAQLICLPLLEEATNKIGCGYECLQDVRVWHMEGGRGCHALVVWFDLGISCCSKGFKLDLVFIFVMCV